MTTGAPEGWQRLHPLSPVVRGGRATIAIAILLAPIALGAGNLGDATPQLAVVGALVFAGFVSWLVTRWRIEGDDLRIETGLLRMQGEMLLAFRSSRRRAGASEGGSADGSWEVHQERRQELTVADVNAGNGGSPTNPSRGDRRRYAAAA